MANFVICLEIRERSRDYSRLRQILTNMAAAQVLDSVWFASINGRAEQLRDAIQTVVYPGDSIVVVRLQDTGESDWSAFHEPREGLHWLKTHYR